PVTDGVWSPDGARLMFRTSADAQSPARVLVAAIGDSSKAPAPQSIPFTGPVGGSFVPTAWSTDGRRLAVHQVLPGAPPTAFSGVLIYDFDTHRVQRLTEFGGRARWLADNRR